MLAADSGVMSNVPPGAKWGGSPAGPAREWLKGAAAVRRLVEEQRSGREDWSMQIWQLLTLELWFQAFVDGARDRHQPAFAGPAAIA